MCIEVCINEETNENTVTLELRAPSFPVIISTRGSEGDFINGGFPPQTIKTIM